MGPRITVGSATLMNKALEVIELHHLFGLERERIEIVIHPQSVVHSMVEFVDGSVIAQMGPPDMRAARSLRPDTPRPCAVGSRRFSLDRFRSLTFEAPDPLPFPGARARLPLPSPRARTPAAC
jgi:1-deoxy-D-xylulose-5-phosphate reductoisomerase